MIRKFRSIEEMNEAQRPVVETDPARLLQRVRELFALAETVGGERFTGVHKFRSIEESNRFRRVWMTERAKRMRGEETCSGPIFAEHPRNATTTPISNPVFGPTEKE